MPPRRLSIDVYTTVPTGTSTSFPHTHWRSAVAPEPSTSSFENEDSSNSAAVVLVARASAPMAGLQCPPAQPVGRVPSSAAGSATPAPDAFGSNQFGRSQPDFSPKTAPRAASRAYAGERRSGRPA